MFPLFKKLYLKRALCLTLAAALAGTPFTSTLKAQSTEDAIREVCVATAMIVGASYFGSYLQNRLSIWLNKASNSQKTPSPLIRQPETKQSPNQPEKIKPQQKHNTPFIKAPKKIAQLKDRLKQQVPTHREPQHHQNPIMQPHSSSHADGNQISYTYMQRHSAHDLEQLVEQLRAGTLSGDQLDENTLWELFNYIKNHKTLCSLDKQDIKLLHELGKAFRKTNACQQSLQHSLAANGNIPASAQTTAFIHNLLREKGCPEWNVPVYQCSDNKDENRGKCDVHGIWIKEDKPGVDKEVCAHEAGHWYHQHTLHTMFNTNLTTTQKEYEADNFAYEFLSPRERLDITKAYLGLNPHYSRLKIEPYYSNWIRIAKEHGEYPMIAA